MNRTRFLALAAFSFVLYVSASAGARGAPLELGQALTLLVAAGLAWAEARLSSGELTEAKLRVCVLGAALSFSLSAWVARGLFALAGELFLAVFLPLSAAMLAELALGAPDVPPRLLRHARARLAAIRWLCAGASLCGVAAASPPVWLFGRAWIAPAVVATLPGLFTLCALCAALLLRALRRRFGSDAQAMAANLWPATSLFVGASLLALGAVLRERQAPVGVVDACAGVAASLVMLGHVWLVAPERAATAGPMGRTWLANGVAMAITVAAGLGLSDLWPIDPVLRAAALALLLMGFEGLRVSCKRLFERSLSPDRGRLLRAVEEASAALRDSQSLEDLAARVLGPLRRAARVPEAVPLLFTVHPQHEFRLDAAGRAQAHSRPLPEPLSRQFQRAGFLPLVRENFAALVVRRPELREVSQALEEAGALLALPLVIGGELEGVLLVARGARTAPLTLEEVIILERFGRAVGSLIAVFSASARAYARSEAAAQRLMAAASEADDLSHELASLGARFNALAACTGRSQSLAPKVAYSAAMRGLIHRLEQVAPHDLPLALHGEVGTGVEGLARLVHTASGRANLPFVAMHCGTEPPQTAERALFGDRTTTPPVPGALELASHGTLFLFEVAALPLALQRALAQALSSRRVLPVGSQSGYPLDARVIASTRRPVAELVLAGTFAPELARWFAPTSYRVPPLRECVDDLESLVMIAVDRAARVLGCPVPGLTPEALRALFEYTWPGNLEELESVVSRAVLACRGPRITASDLPPLPSPLALQSGSFDEQERDILQRALAQAGGNATRAARALGLKRTTFVEKLRRHALDEAGAARQH